MSIQLALALICSGLVIGALAIIWRVITGH